MSPRLLLLLSLLALPLHAQILLTVDESDPSAIVITATDATPTFSSSSLASNASGTVLSYTFYEGIDLLNFFSTDATSLYSTAVSTLSTGDGSSGPVLDGYDGDFVTDGGTNGALDLDLFDAEASNPATDPADDPAETFSSGISAFSTGGSIVIDVAQFPGIELAGTSGELDAGFSASADGPTQIGTYEVLGAPEPSTYAMLLGGMILLGLCLRRAQATL